MEEYKIFIRLLLVKSRMLSSFQMLSLLERMSGDGGKQKNKKKPKTLYFSTLLAVGFEPTRAIAQVILSHPP